MGQIVLLSSAVRNATNSGIVTKTWTERGGHFILAISAVPGVDTVTLNIEGLDALGNAYPILTSAALVAAATTVLRIYPGLAAAANLAVSDFLPDRWRYTLTHSAGSNFTYSLCLNTME